MSTFGARICARYSVEGIDLLPHASEKIMGGTHIELVRTEARVNVFEVRRLHQKRPEQ